MPGNTPSDARAASLLHELQVHQVELEMQNEELRRAHLALERARDRYVDLYDLAPVGYLSLSALGVVTEANLTGAALLGMARAQLVGRHFARQVTPADSERWHRYTAALLGDGAPAGIELALERPDGRGVFARIDGTRVTEPGAGPSLRVTLTDITERKRAESELRLAATAFDAQEGIMITDGQGVIERVNKAFTRITGYEPAEVIGKTARVLHSGRHNTEFYQSMWATLRDTGTWQGEIWNQRANGEIYPEWLAITAVQDDDLQAVRYVGTMVDISERKAHDDEIARLAFFDPLTGLPNRSLLQDRLNQALASSARSGFEGALMLIDLDNFKRVNDTLGHDQGDLLLLQVAQRLAACVREGDTVARIGGDEFVVMLAANLSAVAAEATAQARLVGEKVLTALSRPYTLGTHTHFGGASVGITLFSDHLCTVVELLKRADQAMYMAKAAGRNTLRFFDVDSTSAERTRASLEADLRGALQHGEFVLYYQPEVGTAHRLFGAEALVRWQHPSRGLLLPGAFIGLAEDSGLIQALGQWVLQTACAQLAAWAGDPELAQLRLSVNISPRQLRDRHFVQQVIELVDSHGVHPSRIKLELTESMMLDNLEDTIGKMTALKAHGIGFSMDDFGTGYASLSHLKNLPLDQLKIDRSFVQDMLTNPRDAAIARTIVELGRSLGLTVIAEGVENDLQRQMLAAFGCHVFQGSLFGWAEPVESLVKLAHSAPVGLPEAPANR